VDMIPKTMLLLRLLDDGQDLESDNPVFLLLLLILFLHSFHHWLSLPSVINHFDFYKVNSSYNFSLKIILSEECTGNSFYYTGPVPGSCDASV
jgi:hypothetical protein